MATGLSTITSQGAFDGSVAAQINGNFAALQGIDVWVRPQAVVGEQTGSYDKPFATMSAAMKYATPGLVVGLQGVLRENFVAPAINDITIVGLAVTPRQSTDSGIPNGGSATWLSLSTPAASSLVKIGGTSSETHVSQGWTFRNIFFNNASTTSTTACVELLRGDGSGVDVGRDASHAAFYNCKFTGGNYGILDQGGCSFVTVSGCQFYGFAGAGDTAIKQGTATNVALPLQWQIVGNQFYNNYAHIVTPLSSANINGNLFGWKGYSITSTVQVHIDGGGKNNVVMGNFFQIDEPSGTATMFGGGTDDGWINYYASGLVAGVPI